MVWVVFDDLYGSLKNQSYYSTGNNLSDTYSQHHKRNRKIHSVSKTEYEWYDDCVRHDWRNRCKKTITVAKLVSKYSTDQCCNASEDDIYRNRAAKKIGDDTSDK